VCVCVLCSLESARALREKRAGRIKRVYNIHIYIYIYEKNNVYYAGRAADNRRRSRARIKLEAVSVELRQHENGACIIITAINLCSNNVYDIASRTVSRTEIVCLFAVFKTVAGPCVCDVVFVGPRDRLLCRTDKTESFGTAYGPTYTSALFSSARRRFLKTATTAFPSETRFRPFSSRAPFRLGARPSLNVFYSTV